MKTTFLHVNHTLGINDLTTQKCHFMKFSINSQTKENKRENKPNYKVSTLSASNQHIRIEKLKYS